MKFKAAPNLYVRILKKRGRPKNIRSVQFDENGEFVTDNPFLVALLRQCPKCAEQIEPKPQAESFKCKKCDFETDSKGKLLAHYGQNHKKGE